MPKRKRVPQALHEELSEYSSLLRALRTNDTLDLTKHITKPRDPGLGRSSPSEARAADEQPDEEQPGEEQPEEEKPKPKRRKRDTWTRWPLLVNDVHVPEWGLEDEIEALMRFCLRNNPHPVFQESDDAEEAVDKPASLPYLTQSASDFLSSILALIAHHTPERPQSMQNRLNPIGWQTVLEILGCCGNSTIDAEMISNVKTRMEAISGPYESHAAARVTTRAVKSRATMSALDQADEALFILARRGRPPKRQRTAAEEDIDSDDLDS
ncbi:hypothetical protein FB451DRAFT_1443846 [Mycena latifolia]|nr:hypothetical protein FB451DRAFT_1443846 [Mycena latifolia]